MDGKKCSHPSSFFNINLSDSVEVEDGGTFVFPKRFIKEHGERLSNRVRLQVPTGTESKMMLKRCDDGQVSLHKGWRDFVDKYSIKYLYLLVFTYKGGSRFQVRIFDFSGSEIEYPRTSCVNPRSNMAMYPSFFKTVLGYALEEGTLELPISFVKKHGESLSTSAYLNVPTGEKSKVELKMNNGRAWLHHGWKDFANKYSIKCGYFLVFQYEAPSQFDVQIYDLTCSEIEYPRPSRKRKMSRESRCRQQCASIGNESQGSDQVERAKALQSSNLVFTVTMKPSYVCAAAYLPIPSGPVRDFFLEKGYDRHKIINLHLNGKAWSMNCYFTGSPSHPGVRFCFGWPKFRRENNLQKGEVCSFELVNSRALDFKVTISRINDSTFSEIEYPRSRKRKMELEVKMTNQSNFSGMIHIGESRSRQQCASIENKSQGFEQVSSNLVFTVTMKPAYNATYLHIPAGPVSDFLLEKGNDRQEINLHLNGTVWSTNCYFTGAPPHLQVRISLGWPRFSRENNLQEEDVCSFELVNSSTMDFKVTISRKNDEEQRLRKRRTRGRPTRVGSTAWIRVLENDEEQQLSKRTRGRPPRMGSTARIRVLGRLESFKSDNPHFKINMGPYYMSDNDNISVQIPADYSRKYIEKDEHGEQVMIIIHGSSGKTWPLQYFFSTNARAFLYRGWMDFVKDNHLKVGDACIFERIDGKAKKYRVHIFREADQA